MREQDKREQMTPQEEMLTEVLDACMEEELSFIPSESEIARMHTFSGEFKDAMEQMLRTKGKKEGQEISKREFTYGFNRIAACILAVLLVGGIGLGGWALIQKNKTESAEDTAAARAEKTEEIFSGEAAQEETAQGETIPEEEITGEAYPEEASFMGEMISAAPEQNLPETAGKIRTLVNSPVIARDAKSITVTIGNMEEHPIVYYAVMDLQVLIDGVWYQVPSRQELTEEEAVRKVQLEPAMAQNEELLLEYYHLDYNAEQYRVVTYTDDTVLCSTFVFENTVEELEEVLDFSEE